MKLPAKPPSWLPFLGPVLAAGAGMLAGEFWLGGGFWMVFSAGIACGFAPIVIYRLWKRWHHRR
ncbi:MAG: hypothetical protein EBR82_41195 [Caulobacteraceae bacterium]|nr:hypothetical protein [Caulobacteraceae bacterium]